MIFLIRVEIFIKLNVTLKLTEIALEYAVPGILFGKEL